MIEKHHDAGPSSLDRIEACPGSLKLSRKVYDLTTNEFAEHCKDLHHRVPVDRHLTDLTAEDADMVEWCRDMIKTLRIGVKEEYYEQKMFLMDGFKVITYGTADYIGVRENLVLLADFKFGFIPVNPVHLNWQMATYSVMAMIKYDRPEASAYVFQPRDSRTPSHFSFTDPEAIISNIKRIIDRAENDDGLTLRPSEHACKYCPAYKICPAVQLDVLVVDSGIRNLIKNDARRAFELVKMAKKFNDVVSEEIKMLLRAGIKLPGLELKTRGGASSVKDIQETFNLLSAYFTLEEFLGECSVSVSKLKDRYARKVKATGECKTLVEAKNKFNEILEPQIVTADGSEQINPIDATEMIDEDQTGT